MWIIPLCVNVVSDAILWWLAVDRTGFFSPFTVYPKKYAHGFVVLCFVVVMQSFIMNSHEVFIHIHQGCFAGTGAIVTLPQCQWSKPDGYGKISQCITTTKHSKAQTVCIFLGIYCTKVHSLDVLFSYSLYDFYIYGLLILLHWLYIHIYIYIQILKWITPLQSPCSFLLLYYLLMFG